VATNGSLGKVAERKPPPRLLLAWEALPARKQAAIAFPFFFLLAFLVHLGPFAQPLGRALGYGLFYGLLLTGATVAATRNEAERRRQRLADEEESGPGRANG
jgi:hypothetical protein